MNYALNLRSILLLLAMVQGLVIAALLFARGWQRRQVRDFFLAGLLLALVMSLISYFIGFMGVYDLARAQGWDLTYFPFGNVFLFGPLIWLYVRAVAERTFSWQRRYGWHFALPGLYYAVFLYLWSLPLAAKQAIGDWPSLLAEDASGVLVQGFYLFDVWRRFREYHRQAGAENAGGERPALDWLRNFLYAFSAYFFVELAFSLANLRFELWYTGWYWLELARAFLLYYVSVAGWAFTQKAGAAFPATAEKAAAKPLFTAEELPIRCAKLRQIMLTERPWLDPDLTLPQLAAQAGLNASQLSYLVNAGLGKNFNDFVNEYRVEAVKATMQDPGATHLSLLGVAFSCGFNSKATFNRAFKKITGVAPSEFKP